MVPISSAIPVNLNPSSAVSAEDRRRCNSNDENLGAGTKARAEYKYERADTMATEYNILVATLVIVTVSFGYRQFYVETIRSVLGV